ncbi:MAG: DUF1887 family protein [Microbacteriaceae bacterium]|nr:DUF1887 family protein [Microbacteriaceae bacterium]
MSSLPRYDVHVCLVSDQATPNFIPVLDSRFRPREVVLVVSPEMGQRASWLRDRLVCRALRVIEYPVRDAWDIPGVQDALIELVAARAGENLALNVTGGTKPMAIAAQEVFRAENLPIFYVHPRENTVRLLFTGEPPIIIEDRVQFEDYLGIHGFRELGRDTRRYDEDHIEFCNELVKEVDRFGHQIRRLNWHADQARGSMRAALGKDASDPRLLELTDKLQRYGVAEVEKNDDLVFPHEVERFFVNGGWLEWYIFEVVSRLVREIGVQDLARSLTVESGHHARNELDIALLAHNRLFLIECKARVMAGERSGRTGTQSLYKLDSLRALGGLNTRGMLVSYQPLESWDRQRAEDLRIRVVESGQLRNFERHLREWVTAS